MKPTPVRTMLRQIWALRVPTGWLGGTCNNTQAKQGSSLQSCPRNLGTGSSSRLPTNLIGLTVPELEDTAQFGSHERASGE
jgi:hypothetical protein